MRLPIRISGVLAVLIAAGCATVGPNYVPPETSVSKDWHAQLGGSLTPKDVDPQTLASWWTTLNDPELSSLVERAVAGNLDLKKALARVREARARRGLAQAGSFPTLDATGSATRSRNSKQAGGGTTSAYAAGIDAGWELDVFGGTRRSVEAAEGDLQASHEDLRDVMVTLTGEVALNYVEVRTYQARIALTEASLETENQTCQLTLWMYQAGLSDELAVEQARYNLESARSQIPSLRTGLAEAENRLAVLLGREPSTINDELEERKSIPVASTEITIGVPADVLRRRPDVRRAERQLAAQTARIGVATAELYPNFKLSGSIGLDALSLGRLFSSDALSSSGGGGISWRVFDAGAIRRDIQVQSAQQEQYLIAYEAAVLNALEEVENALAAYAGEQSRRQSLIDSIQAAQRAAELAQHKYQAGLTDFSNVLDAQRSLLSFRDQLAQSEGAVTSDLVRLYKALGGGWTSLDHDEKDAKK